ncbi:transmembrane protein 199 [Galendromus occidentalis]|uniref:Transmembrane protein 199 n=1 Tax=Galendromus occidentalis TaxID=34638 RepID=A0AAJ6QM94_9ACAR|nr:transmembrane protein 199 [Galendromus occidentalis]
MSDYSYSYPCTHIRLSSVVADELRKTCESMDGSDDYLIELRSHLSTDKPMPFKLIKTFWEEHKKGTALHKWISGCALILPEVVVPPRNDELEKRCQKLRAQQSHAEYNKMVKGIDKKVPTEAGERAIWREIRNQYIAVINMVLTIGGTFVFVYKAVEYSLPAPNPAAQTLLGIFACLVVATAELYFLLRDLS